MGFGSTPTYHPVNRLQVPEAAMRVNRRKTFKNIMAQGQWTVKKLDFNLSDQVTLRTRVTGVGMGYLYASFVKDGQPHILTIKKVTPGFHDLHFTVPYPVLEQFRIGISTTVPKGYSIDILPKSDRYKLRTNSMMLSQSTPMYESQGIGFAGLGSAHLDITTGARGGMDSARNPYWDGDWNTFSWNNGFTGSPETHSNVNNENSPKIRGSYHGYYATRMTLMVARFDAEDRFLGWDAIEQKDQTIPTGVPIMVAMQLFVLQKKTKSGSGPREAKDPYWEYAEGMTPQASKCSWIDSQWNGCRKVKTFSQDPRPNNASKGVAKNVSRQYVVNADYDNSGFKVGDRYYDVRDIACKLEWYDESSGQWSMPKTNPASVPETNEKGFTRLIFRIPRQLSANADKDIIEELSQHGVDYRYETTKNYFPYPVGDRYNPAKIGYVIPSRPVDEGKQIEYEEDGNTYIGVRKTMLDFYFGYGKHKWAGVAGNDGGGPKPGWIGYSPVSFYTADVDKMARGNNPELLNAFYPAGGFKTGGVVIAIAKGMSMNHQFVIRKDAATKGAFGNYPVDTNGDGSNIGTREAGLLKPTGIILATDLDDDRQAATEEVVLAAWKAKFGEPLTKAFFEKYSFKDQSKEKPTHYRARDPDSGVYVEAPYQIVYFKIGPEYNGPYADYSFETTRETNAEGQEEEVTKLVLSNPDNKPYAISKGDSLYLHCQTNPYLKYLYQKIDIVDEVVEQRTLIDAGLTPEETMAYNTLNNPPVETSAAVAEMNQQNQYLLDMARHGDTGDGGDDDKGGDPDKPKLPSGAKYIRSGDKWRLNPKYYARESQLKDAGFLGGIKSALSGFTDSRDFYVEDVTDKWGASTRAGLGGIGYGYSEFVDDMLEDTGDVVVDAGRALSYGAGSVFEVAAGNPSAAARKFAIATKNAADLAFSAGDLLVEAPINVARLTDDAIEDVGGLVGDMVGLGAIAPRGLGESTADKLERYGENTTSFFKGAAKGIIPNKIQDGFGDSVDSIVDSFNKRPVLYTAMGLAAVPLLIPGIGGAYARNISTLAGGAVSLVPRAFRAGVDTISTVSSGAIDGVKSIGSSIAGTPSKRGTAARRRRYSRR